MSGSGSTSTALKRPRDDPHTESEKRRRTGSQTERKFESSTDRRRREMQAIRAKIAALERNLLKLSLENIVCLITCEQSMLDHQYKLVKNAAEALFAEWAHAVPRDHIRMSIPDEGHDASFIWTSITDFYETKTQAFTLACALGADVGAGPSTRRLVLRALEMLKEDHGRRLIVTVSPLCTIEIRFFTPTTKKLKLFSFTLLTDKPAVAHPLLQMTVTYHDLISTGPAFKSTPKYREYLDVELYRTSTSMTLAYAMDQVAPENIWSADVLSLKDFKTRLCGLATMSPLSPAERRLYAQATDSPFHFIELWCAGPHPIATFNLV